MTRVTVLTAMTLRCVRCRVDPTLPRYGTDFMTLWVAFCLILLATAGHAAGQTVEKISPKPADSSRLDSLRREGYEALYNLDYEGARRRFKEMTDLTPDHPAGPQCFAASLWLQQLNQSWELKASLYNSESYYAGKKDLVDTRRMEEFRQWTRRAKLLAEARLVKNPRDTEALYFLGATDGLTAFAAISERRFMAALRDGSRSVDRHREVLKLVPTFHDAELTIGLQNYIVGALPLPAKILAGTMGVRGSKKRGLETLERVAREGIWARDLARVLLIDLYKREKRLPEAVDVARELSRRYPRNYLFKLQTADALVLQVAALRKGKGASADAGSAEQREAFGIFESLLRSTTDGPSSPVSSGLIHFRYGEALIATGQPERAAKAFLAVVTQNRADANLRTMAHLRVAQSLDLAGKRAEALAEYRAILGNQDSRRMHEEARRGLRQPYQR